jgi:hypothetical protein
MHGRELAAFVLAVVVAVVNLLVVLPLALFVALAKCDESCHQSPDRGWRDDPDAWQWNALTWLAVVGIVLALALPFFVAFRAGRGARVAAVGYTLAAAAYLGLLLVPDTGNGGLWGSNAVFVFAVFAIPSAALISAWLTPSRHLAAPGPSVVE